MTANEEGLLVEFDVTEETMLGAAHHVIDSHLKTFAFREGIEGMVWDT